MNDSMENDPKALERVHLVIQVQSGQLTATEAAGKMGVSRKTYYKWERRCLRAMMEAMKEKDSGRPSFAVDQEKETLKQENEELKKDVLLLEQTLHIREVLKQATDESLPREKKG
jgi:transposase